MPKFSIIIPVYNVEKYIKDCLDSIKRQTYKNYEIILINDGSQDKSMSIASKYNVITINQKNQGQSVARNNGIKKATGEYLVFLDADDTIEKDLLKKINDALEPDLDILRFQVRTTFEDKPSIDYPEKGFGTCSGNKAFEKLCGYRFVEAVCLYAVRREFYLKEKFSFAKGMLHEDFRLIPLMIMKAKKVKSISYIGYNYLQRENSTMHSQNDYKKTKRKVEDFYKHYTYLIDEVDKMNLNNKTFKSYISNSVITKITELKGNDYKKYKKKLKEDKVFDNILTDTLARKIKKVVLKVDPKLYYRKK